MMSAVRRTVVPAILLLILAACGGDKDSDQLSAARRNLRPAACGDSPAVAGASGVNADPHQVYLGDWIIVSVCHLDQLLKAADAAQQPLTLVIEGIDSGNEPVGVDLDSGTVTFVLDRTVENRKLWKPFLYDPLFDPLVTMHISAGIRGERPLPRAPRANMTVRLKKIYVDWATWVWLALLALVTLVIALSAAYTDMLREGPDVDGARQPFSLGRTQMAWWFFLIVLSYSFIWLVTGDRDTIPPSLLGLMGISAATALAAAAIAKTAARVSHGLWRDLVADERGSAVALDRLQIVVWTVVLSGVFLSSVIWDLTMPEFNATLLALMGISSGTYIGFKLPTSTSTSTSG
ncbi:MAG: hypothetical protein QOI24_3497 [Acidobacteriota bacterium]|jgi:hypothetical protein|nr:hypothetical protein [Acidobacteriota bacterium]